jgi:hypothetical protein
MGSYCVRPHIRTYTTFIQHTYAHTTHTQTHTDVKHNVLFSPFQELIDRLQQHHLGVIQVLLNLEDFVYVVRAKRVKSARTPQDERSATGNQRYQRKSPHAGHLEPYVLFTTQHTHTCTHTASLTTDRLRQGRGASRPERGAWGRRSRRPSESHSTWRPQGAAGTGPGFL